jgi:hypothetical protein
LNNFFKENSTKSKQKKFRVILNLWPISWVMSSHLDEQHRPMRGEFRKGIAKQKEKQ